MRAFILANLDLLEDPKQSSTSVGTWYNPDDGNTYLDISVTVSDLAQAIAIGRRYNQTAIFDLQQGRVIELTDVGGDR
ncbi:MAG: hypothetical protein ACR2PL_14910 [Dehalococcoidia bacterium]